MALAAADRQGLDLDELHFYRTGQDTGLWGWMDAADAEVMKAADSEPVVVETVTDPVEVESPWVPHPVDEDEDVVEGTDVVEDDEMSADSIMARNAARRAQAPGYDAHGFYDIALDPNPPTDEEPANVNSDNELVNSTDELIKSAGELVTLTNDLPPVEAPRLAAPGDLVLMAGGPAPPARAQLDAQAFAKKLGVTITLRDAMTMEVVKVIEPRTRSAKGEKEPGRVGGPSDLQRKLIDLCTRTDPVGATSQELLAAGAGGAAKKNTIAWRQLAIGCERYGYKFSIGSRITNNRVMTAYVLTPTGPANDDTVQTQAAE